MALRGPTEITFEDRQIPDGVWYSQYPTVPVYDHRTSEIIWTYGNDSYTRYSSGNYVAAYKMYDVHLCRIQAHFLLSSLHKTPLSASTPPAPSLILANGKVTVGTAADETESYRNADDKVGITRQGRDGEWTKMSFNSTWIGGTGAHGHFYNPRWRVSSTCFSSASEVAPALSIST